MVFSTAYRCGAAKQLVMVSLARFTDVRVPRGCCNHNWFGLNLVEERASVDASLQVSSLPVFRLP